MYYRHTDSCFSQAHPTGLTLPLPSLSEHSGLWVHCVIFHYRHYIFSCLMSSANVKLSDAYTRETYVRRKWNKGKGFVYGFWPGKAQMRKQLEIKSYLPILLCHPSSLAFYFRHHYPSLRGSHVFHLFNFLYLQAGSATEAELYCAMISMPSQRAFAGPVKYLNYVHIFWYVWIYRTMKILFIWVWGLKSRRANCYAPLHAKYII